MQQRAGREWARIRAAIAVSFTPRQHQSLRVSITSLRCQPLMDALVQRWVQTLLSGRRTQGRTTHAVARPCLRACGGIKPNAPIAPRPHPRTPSARAWARLDWESFAANPASAPKSLRTLHPRTARLSMAARIRSVTPRWPQPQQAARLRQRRTGPLVCLVTNRCALNQGRIRRRKCGRDPTRTLSSSPPARMTAGGNRLHSPRPVGRPNSKPQNTTAQSGRGVAHRLDIEIKQQFFIGGIAFLHRPYELHISPPRISSASFIRQRARMWLEIKSLIFGHHVIVFHLGRQPAHKSGGFS